MHIISNAFPSTFVCLSVCVGGVLCIRSTGSTTDPCSPQCVFISGYVTRIVNTASSTKLRVLLCVCVRMLACVLWIMSSSHSLTQSEHGLYDFVSCISIHKLSLEYVCACDFSLCVRVNHAKRLIEGRAFKLLPRETLSHPSPHWLFATRLWTNKLMLNPLWAQGRRWGGLSPWWVAVPVVKGSWLGCWGDYSPFLPDLLELRQQANPYSTQRSC